MKIITTKSAQDEPWPFEDKENCVGLGRVQTLWKSLQPDRRKMGHGHWGGGTLCKYDDLECVKEFRGNHYKQIVAESN